MYMIELFLLVFLKSFISSKEHCFVVSESSVDIDCNLFLSPEMEKLLSNHSCFNFIELTLKVNFFMLHV